MARMTRTWLEWLWFPGTWQTELFGSGTACHLARQGVEVEDYLFELFNLVKQKRQE